MARHMLANISIELRLVLIHQKSGFARQLMFCLRLMTNARRLIAGVAALDLCGCLRSRPKSAVRGRPSIATRTLAANANHEISLAQASFKQHRLRTAEAQVNIVPKYGCVALRIVRHIGRHRRMLVPLDHFKVQRGCHLKQRSRKLAKASTGRRNDAALAHLAPHGKAARAPRRTNLRPKTESVSGGKHATINSSAG